MLKTISDELIKHLYELSQLQYEKDEAKEIKAELEEMLNYFAREFDSWIELDFK